MTIECTLKLKIFSDCIEIRTNNSLCPAPKGMEFCRTLQAFQCITGSTTYASDIITSQWINSDTWPFKKTIIFNEEDNERHFKILVNRDKDAFIAGFTNCFIFQKAFPHLFTTKELQHYRKELEQLGVSTPSHCQKKSSEADNKLHEELHPYETKFKTDFLRRIPKEEREAILKQIDLLKEPLSQQELKAFINGEWSHSIFKQENWPLLALKAYLEGLLNETTVSKLFLYDRCVLESTELYPMRTYQIVENDQGKSSWAAFKKFSVGLGQYYSVKEKETIVEKLMKMPLSTGQFFTVTRPSLFDTYQKIDSDAKAKKLIDVCSYLIYGQFPFLQIDQDCQLVIPPELLNIIYEVKFGGNAIKTNPVIGYFKIEKLSNKDSRVVAIPCRYVSQASMVHRHSCTPLTGYHHDAAYHCFLESGNVHRPAWIELAFACKEIPKILPTLFDRECGLYTRPDTHFPNAGRDLHHNDEKFYYSLSYLYGRIKRKFETSTAIQMLALMVQYISQNASEWQSKYHLNLQQLERLYQKEKRSVLFVLSPDTLLPSVYTAYMIYDSVPEMPWRIKQCIQEYL